MGHLRAAVMAVLCLASSASLALPSYSVLALPIVGPSYAQPYAINNAGIVVGRVPFGNWDYRAFSSDGTTMTNLAAVSGVTITLAYAINNVGQIVGSGGTSGAFIYDNGVVTEPPTLGGPNASAFGLNDLGWVVGISQNSAQQSQAFIYKNGTTSPLKNLTPGLLNAASTAYAVNNSGAIVGISNTTSGDVAVRWDPDGNVYALGGFGGTNSVAAAINEAGQVVGYAEYTPGSIVHGAFIWENGVMTDLGNLGTVDAAANAINESGWVVGGSTYANGQGAGFLWTKDDGMVALDSLLDPAYSGWYIAAAVGINDSGQIAAFATTSPGSKDFFAVILNPIQLGEIPTPATLALVGIGFTLLIAAKTRPNRLRPPTVQ